LVSSEGNALSDSDSWLDYYVTPCGSTMSSQDISRLVGRQYDRFMDRLNAEHDRLVADESALVQKEYEKYIKVYRNKYARRRIVEYDTGMIAQHRNSRSTVHR
jgi:hypothetical protein